MKAKSYIKLLVQKSPLFMTNNSSSLRVTVCAEVKERERPFLPKIYHFKYCADRL